MFKRLIELCQPHKVIISTVVVIFLGIVLPFIWFLQREPREFKEPLPIAFSGGSFMQKARITSLQALMDNYNRGFTFFQISMGFNKNNELACKRIMTQWGMVDPGNDTPALYGGEKQEYGGYSFDYPCSAKELTDWLLKTGNTHVVVDMQDNPVEGLRKLKEMLPSYRKQVIVQLENTNDYAAIRDLGYNQFVYFVRDFRKDAAELVGELSGKYFQAVVLPMQLVDRHMVRRLQRHDIKTYTYVVDDCETMVNLGVMGVDGIYTNVISPTGCDRRLAQFRLANPGRLGK